MASVDDVLAINRLRYEYAFGIDTRDYVLFRSVFLDQVTMDFSSYSGKPAARMSADDWVAGAAALFDSLDATQHSMTNPLVDIADDSATATQRMAMQAAHFLNGVEYTIGGWYLDQVVRVNGRWKIAAVTLNVTWERGDRSIMQRTEKL